MPLSIFNVKKLLDINALDVSIHSQDSKGNTLLHYASACNHFNIVASLLEKGAQSSVPNLEGWNAKDVSHSFFPNLITVRLLK